MVQQISIKFHDTQAGVKAFEATAGAVNRFPVPADVHVEVIDQATGKGPGKVQVRRKRNDLVVRIADESQGGQPVEIILEGYYPQIGCQLVGLNEQGQYVEYKPSGADSDRSLALLRDEDESSIAMAATPIDIAVAPGACAAPFEAAGMLAPVMGARAMSPWLLGGLGLVVAAVTFGGSGDDGGGAGGGGGDSAGGGDDGGGGGVALPATPTVAASTYTDNVGATRNPDSTAALTDDNRPGLRIGARPERATGAVLYVDGILTPATYDEATGTLTPDEPLRDGPHTLGYGWTNAAGSTPSSPTMTVTVDATPPAPPAAFKVADTDGNGKVNITGEGEPGGVATIRDPAGTSYTALIDASGRFGLEIDVPDKPAGEWRATVTDTAENVSEPARVTVSDLTAPGLAVIQAVDDNVGTIQGLVPERGVTDDAAPTLQGTAEPGATVAIRNGGKVIGTALADGSGQWSFTPGEPLTDGRQSLTAQATDPEGNSGLQTNPLIFTVDSIPPAVAAIASLTDNVGRIRGEIVNGTVTDDATPTFSGRAEPNATVIVRDNNTILGTVPVSPDGDWIFTPIAPLADGPHAFTATVRDEAGGLSPATTAISFVVDTIAPATPTVIISVEDDQGTSTGLLAGGIATITDDANPKISGTAEPGTTVIVMDGAKEIGTAAVGADGRWTFTPIVRLLNGVHAITAAAMDVIGQVGQPSAAFEFTLLTGGVPSAPAIVNVIDDNGPVENIAPGGITNDSMPTVTGTAPPGLLVTLLNAKGETLGTALSDANGQWSIMPGVALPDGVHSFIATATSANNNVSEPTGAYRITIDTHVPAPSSIPTLTDNVGKETGLIARGAATDDATPTLDGTAEPGCTVSVFDGTTLIGTALADASGNWTLTPSVPLADGPHAFTAIVTTPAGNSSTPAGPIDFTVDTRAVPISIDEVRDNVGDIQGALAHGAHTDDLQAAVIGRAAPGAQVTLYREGGVVLGTATADAYGRWSITPDAAIPQGLHSLTATARTAAAGESAPTAAFVLTFDSLAPAAPAILQAIDDVGDPQGAVRSGKATDDSTLALSGTAEAGSKVTVFDGDQIIGTTTADGSGNWQLTPATPLNEGTHVLRATATDKPGNVSVPSQPWIAVIDVTPPATAPEITSVEDDQGPSTGLLASGAATVTDDANPKISGKAVPDTTVVIMDGGQEIGRVLAGPDGTWEFTPGLPLLNGLHTITARSRDEVENAGPVSEPFVFTVRTGGVPAAPAITHVIDNVGDLQNIPPGGVTDDSTPTFLGTAPAGLLVTLFNAKGETVGTAVSDGDGQWSITLANPLPDGVQSFTATATGGSGASDPTGAYRFTVDTHVPARSSIPVLTDNVGKETGPIASGGTTDDATPAITGTAEPGCTVSVFDGTRLVGTALADASGNWALTPLVPLADGPHSFTAVVTTPAGKTAAPSDPVDFNVDTRRVLVSINELFDDTGDIQGALAHGAQTDDRQPAVTGRATAGAQVTLYREGRVVLGTTAADENGDWSITPASPLPDGLHGLTATVTTAAAGESEPTTAFALTIDSLPPGRPAITAAYDNVGPRQGPLASGAASDDTTPALTGTAEPNSTVSVFDGHQLIGTTRADGNGNWQLTPATPLNPGGHLVTVRAADESGNVSQPSAPWMILIDVTPPGMVPEISRVFDDQGSETGDLASGFGTYTDDARLEVSGKADPGIIVIIMDNGREIGRTAVSAAGTWTFTPAQPLLNGRHTITVQSVDLSDNLGPTSLPFEFTQHTGGAPTAPAITNVIDDAGPVRNIAPGGVTNDRRPTVTGTAPTGQLVTLYDEKGDVLGTAVADGKGQWSITPAADMGNGSHTFTARATDASGRTSDPTEPYEIVIDGQAPDKAGDLELTDNVGAKTGPITEGMTTDDATPTFSGTGEPGATVTVSDGIRLLGATLVDGSGRWAFTPRTPLEDGPHTLRATVTDPATNMSVATDPISFIVDTSAIVIAIDEVRDNVGTIPGLLAHGGHTDDRQPEVIGTATRGGRVTLYDENATVLGTATADASTGRWSITTSVLQQGPHILSATVTTAASGESGPSVFELVIDSTAPPPPVIREAYDNVGDSQGAMDGSKPSDDSTPTLVGTAEAGSSVSIFDGGMLIGTALADGYGNWDFTPATPLNEGTHVLTATATDESGNESAPSLPWTAVIDVTPPAIAPEIISIEDDQGSSTGLLQSGAGTVTDDANPKISGNGEPGTTVIILDDGHEIGRAAVSGAGTWTFTPTVPLLNGLRTITAKLMDGADNTGPVSEPFVFTLITGGLPVAPTITNVIDDVGGVENIAPGGVTNDPALTVKGTALPGFLVTLFTMAVQVAARAAEGTLEVAGTAVADAYGRWSIPTGYLESGKYELSATAATPDGKSSSTSAYPIEVDLVPPQPAGNLTVTDHAGDETGPITHGMTTDDSRPVFAGTAEPGSKVTVRDGATVLGTALADGSGNWFFIPAKPLADGPHALTATVTDPAGNSSATSAPIGFFVDTSHVAVAIDVVIDNAGAITGPLTHGAYTDDTLPVFNGTAIRGGVVTLYNENGKAIGTAIADAQTGKWTIIPTEPFAEGLHLVTATVTTAAAGESAPTAVFILTVDTHAPLAPVIGQAIDNVGLSQGPVGSGTPTDDGTLTLTGQAEPGSTITFYEGSQFIGSTTAGSDGDWFFTPPTPLNPGRHDLTVTAADKSGNESERSVPWTVTLDTLAPVFTSNPHLVVAENTPAGSGVYVAGAVDEAAVTFAIAGGSDARFFTVNAATGQVTMNFRPDCEAPADSGGNNVYDFTLTATDSVGNVSSQDVAMTVVDVAETPTVAVAMSAGGTFWAMSGGGGHAVRNDFLIGTLKSDMPVTYKTNVPFIHVTADGRVYTHTDTPIGPGGRVVSAAEWNHALGTGSGARPFEIYATSASGETTVIHVKIDIYNNLGAPAGYPGYTGRAVDVDGNGLAHTAAWVGPQDGVLVWDKYGDGRVHDSSQYAFARYVPGAGTDLEGLQAFDANGNGRLDGGDARWSEMKVWQDLNGDGLSGASEVRTLAQWGIASIGLVSDGVASSPAEGVTESGRTSATLADGSRMVVADAAFGTKQSASAEAGVAAHPFILDLNRDGMISYGKSLIDTFGAGLQELMAWAGKEDGVLVWDKYHDGQVHDSSQYSFGALGGDKAGTQGLEVFDTSGDGKLDSHDVLWNALSTWQDANGNGVSDAGEVRTLAQAGIESISLAHAGAVGKPADGVTEAGRTTAAMDNGAQMIVADAAFSYVPADTLHTLASLGQAAHAVI